VEYHRKNFMESLKLYGVDSTYKSITSNQSESYDLYDDIEVSKNATYSDGIPVKVTFEEVPTVKTLKNLGWYTKGDENIPILAHVPVKYEGTEFSPKKDDMLVIAADGYPSKKFLIKDFRGQGFPNVIYWVCKLVKLDVDRE
jgi:hypothetical protein